ncbi:hypothetical protein M3I56_10350 [Paraburkholderia sp. CNPSo 3281]|nr:tetrahydrofolate dehydrogenase/cyclohydrolase catalytic domain-containing protein [Paraburkholderia sp. CNPSo 3281]MCP3715793.1 hypothetical protein [Paraburkholderia sp. CNPSo 3281]
MRIAENLRRLERAALALTGSPDLRMRIPACACFWTGGDWISAAGGGVTPLLDGKKLAALHECALSERVAAVKTRNGGQTPVLATILVGDDPSSATYVRMKRNACRRVGMDSRVITLPSPRQPKTSCQKSTS